jgi:hypothetical protein
LLDGEKKQQGDEVRQVGMREEPSNSRRHGEREGCEVLSCGELQQGQEFAKGEIVGESEM